MKIIHTGLQEQTLKAIKDHLEVNPSEFVDLQESDILIGNGALHDADVLILGEDIDNPIKLAQKVHSQNSYLSIILINEPIVYQKLKQSLLFTPFISPYITNVSSTVGKGLADIVKDHISRTQQRKSYNRFKSSVAKLPVSSLNNFDRIKTDYLNTILQEAPVGLILINKVGLILSYNHHAGILLKKSEKDALGTHLIELLPENEREGCSFFFKEENPYGRKKILKFDDNRGQRFLEITISNLNKEDNTYKIALIQDISSTVYAQHILEESAKKVRIILESMPDIAWTALPNGDINYFNQVWYDYSGQSQEDAFGSGWRKIVYEEDLDPVLLFWEANIKKGKNTCQMECRLKTRTGHDYRWHLIRATPNLNDENNVDQWVGTITDIQAIKQVEEELQETTKMLAASNEELYAANEEILANNDELHSTNEKLQIVNSDLDNFIYTASHDLKAPITNIEGLVHLLTKKLNDVAANKNGIAPLIDMINKSILRFKRTIADLTEISKIQRLADLELEPLSLYEVIHEVSLDLQNQILESGADLQIDVDERAAIKFSRKNLKSIVYNLLSNAIKYCSPDRAPIIQISFSEERNYGVFSVKDNGLGMDLKDEDKIFSMFKRLHSHVEGTGIGLYMVKKIMENAHGNVTVESKIGEGSTFRAYFKTK